jgi:uncharacterized protein YlxP (DUF503 family)
MHLGTLTLFFHLEGCASLKEKRQRIGGLRDRFGRLPSVAACESGAADSHDKGEWSFACLASRRGDVARTLEQIERYAATELDATIYDRQLEYF